MHIGTCSRCSHTRSRTERVPAPHSAQGTPLHLLDKKMTFFVARVTAAQGITQHAFVRTCRVSRSTHVLMCDSAGCFYFCFLSSQTSVIHVTDTSPPVGDNGIDLCVRAEVCPSTKTAPKLPSPIWQVLFDNLRRLAGVSGAGARCRNPDPERSRRGRISSRMPNEKRMESRKSLFM